MAVVVLARKGGERMVMRAGKADAAKSCSVKARAPPRKPVDKLKIKCKKRVVFAIPRFRKDFLLD